MKLSFLREHSLLWERNVEEMIPWGMEWVYEEGKLLYEEGAVLSVRREKNGDILSLVKEEETLCLVCLSFLPPPMKEGKRPSLPSFLGDFAHLCSCGTSVALCPHTVAVMLALGERKPEHRCASF